MLSDHSLWVSMSFKRRNPFLTIAFALTHAYYTELNHVTTSAGTNPIGIPAKKLLQSFIETYQYKNSLEFRSWAFDII